MTIASMTGFARGQGQAGDWAWTWEAKSVNGRGLDVRCRLAAGFERLEISVRERVAKRFSRGSLAISLNVRRAGGHAAITVNTEILERLLALAADVQRRLPEVTPVSPDGLLAIRGVVETVDEELSADEQSSLDAALLNGLDGVLSALSEMRVQEGERLARVLADHVDRIAALAADAETLAAAQPLAIAKRLKDQVAALLESVTPLSEERLRQEAAVLATRADPREELDRLKSHGEAARALLAVGGAVGRRLDFLCQELNREVNTLCSKSTDLELTRAGLELKTTIDQLREQVQNIE